jgi:hypothetical protein
VTVAVKLKAAGSAARRKARPATIKRQGPRFGLLSYAERRAALDRIIAAVGKRPNDEIELLLDINNADHVFDWHLEIKDSAAGRARVTNIRKGIEHCLKLIESHPWIKEIAGPYQLARLLTAVRVHEQWQKSVLRERDKQRGKGLREATAVEWLIGVSLAKVYEKRFGSPTWRRDEGGKPQGPVIDFIEATTAAFNLHCSRELIGRALTRLKSMREFVGDNWANIN